MSERFQIHLDIVIRDATHADLSDLEWHGLFTDARQILADNMQRAVNHEIAYLVADLNGYPVGQVQIDFEKYAGGEIAVIWALRVLPALQGNGIGSWLLDAAESSIQQRGFTIAELAVGKDNPRAKKLYLSRGYQVVRENTERWSYINLKGETVEVVEDTWLMQKPL